MYVILQVCCELRTCFQLPETDQIGAIAITMGPVKLGKETATMIIIVLETPFVDVITARTFGHKLIMELIAAFQTHLQVAKVSELSSSYPSS